MVASAAGQQSSVVNRLLSIMALTVLAAAPVRAQSTLERMQDELSAIVTRAKAAVVSIENEMGSHRSVDMSTAVEEAYRDAAKAFEAVQEKRRAKQRSELTDAQRETLDKALSEARARVQETREKIRELQSRGMVHSFRLRRRVGTGFSIGDGYVVTTADVLDGMEHPVVVTDDGTRIKAEVAGKDPELNVGLLKLPSEAELASLPWGDSTKVRPGFFAISIGNQTGRMNSAALNLVAGVRTDGLLSGSHFYPGLIQVAGTVGAGASGAPLMNVRGEVIGVIAAVPADSWIENRQPTAPPGTPPGFSGVPHHSGRLMHPGAVTVGYGQGEGTGQGEGAGAGCGGDLGTAIRNSIAEGMAAADDATRNGLGTSMSYFFPAVTSAGYAIPANHVREVVEELRRGTPVARGWIGVVPREDQEETSSGRITYVKNIVVIENVVMDSPACRAGMKAGDILVKIDGKPVESAAQVRCVACALRPGTHLSVMVKRSGESRTLDLLIDKRPDQLTVKASSTR